MLSDESLALLQAEAWRGNVRELQNVIERALILNARPAGDPIRAPHAHGARPPSEGEPSRTPSSEDSIRGF